jgi:RNA methyltransferase, TrmH family
VTAPARLSSPRNARVSAARRLGRRHARDAQRAFLAEGPQAVREALARAADEPGLVRELFVDVPSGDRHGELRSAAAALGVPVVTVSPDVLASLSGTVTPQGVVASCRYVDVPLADALAGAPALVAVLLDVRDPGNAGTVLRTADAAGAGAVVLAGDSVDPYNGKAVRASAGSLFHLPVVRGGALDEVLAAVRARGLQVLAADGGGPVDLDDAVDDGTLSRPTAWLFGNEARGLEATVLDRADAVVRVPVHGAAESLNLATAAAVCLYASARALRRAGSVR